MLSFLLSWAPVLLLTVLAVFFRMPALTLSICGSLFTLPYVVILFKTSLTVALLSALDGIVTTLPLLLVVFAGIMLSTLLQATGSLSRIVTWFMGGVRDALHRSLLIIFGVANFMEGASVIAEPVVAPMLRSAGVSPAGSAALSIIGYAGLMTLEMAGIIVIVLSLVTGIPVYELGVAAGWLSIPANCCHGCLCAIVPAALCACHPPAFAGDRLRIVRECCSTRNCYICRGADIRNAGRAVCDCCFDSGRAAADEFVTWDTARPGTLCIHAHSIIPDKYCVSVTGAYCPAFVHYRTGHPRAPHHHAAAVFSISIFVCCLWSCCGAA
jgi:hypothetical protein